MCRTHFYLLAVLACVSLSTAHEPPPATAPSNSLIGRWEVLSIGKKKLPAEVRVFWNIDTKNVMVTTADGEVFTTSQYTLRLEDRRNIIELCEDGKSKPNRVGIYEMTDQELRLQLTLDTGKPPEKWDEDKVMRLQRVLAK